MRVIERIQRPVISLFRAVTGLLFVCHGTADLFGFPAGASHGGAPAVGAWPGWYAAIIELVCGALVLLGLGTRGAAFICSGAMAYAYFTVHQPHALWPIQNGGEKPVLFCWAFLAVVVVGAGPWSLDALLSRRRQRQPAAVKLTAAS